MSNRNSLSCKFFIQLLSFPLFYVFITINRLHQSFCLPAGIQYGIKQHTLYNNQELSNYYLITACEISVFFFKHLHSTNSHSLTHKSCQKHSLRIIFITGKDANKNLSSPSSESLKQVQLIWSHSLFPYMFLDFP